MPTTYTHDRFGMDVLRQLPQHIADLIRSQENLYHIGLQGPDLFFYYHPLKKNPVSRIGSEVHSAPGRVFFTHAAEVVRAAEEAPYLAYVYGSICHFVLDRECHYEVFDFTRTHGVSHAEIEGELDRVLLQRDGRDPVRADLVSEIHPGREAAEVIAAFYTGLPLPGQEMPVFTVKQMEGAIRSFVQFNDLLRAPQRWKRGIIYAGLKAAGMYSELQGHIINYEENPDCREVLERLIPLYEAAVPKAVALITEFADNMTGALPWSSLYEMNYESDYPKELRMTVNPEYRERKK